MDSLLARVQQAKAALAGIDPVFRAINPQWFTAVDCIVEHGLDFTRGLAELTEAIKAEIDSLVAQRAELFEKCQKANYDSALFKQFTAVSKKHTSAVEAAQAVQLCSDVVYTHVLRHPSTAQLEALTREVAELRAAAKPKKRSRAPAADGGTKKRDVSRTNIQSTTFRKNVFGVFKSLPHQPALQSGNTAVVVKSRETCLVKSTVMPVIVHDEDSTSHQYVVQDVNPTALPAESLTAIGKVLESLNANAEAKPWRAKNMTYGNKSYEIWQLQMRFVMLSKDGFIALSKLHEMYTLPQKMVYGPSLGFKAKDPEAANAYYVYACTEQLSSLESDPHAARTPPAFIFVPAEFADGSPLVINGEVYDPKMLFSSHSMGTKRLSLTACEMLFGANIKKQFASPGTAAAAAPGVSDMSDRIEDTTDDDMAAGAFTTKKTFAPGATLIALQKLQAYQQREDPIEEEFEEEPEEQFEEEPEEQCRRSKRAKRI